MSYIGSYDIDDNLTFYANTHDPATAGQVDADANPGYRIYEDESGTPLLTGSMAKLDDANTTGYYSEQVALSAANGFERGKCYSIRITGVVGGVTAVALREFNVGAKVDVRAWLGTTPATPGTAGCPSVDAIRISTSATAADNVELAGIAYSATRGLSGTALPAAAADAAGGLPISDAGGLDLDAQVGTDIDAILADTGTDGVVVAASSKTGYALSAAGVQAIWDALTAALTTVGSIGKKLADWTIHSAADVWAVGTRVLTASTNLNDPTAAAVADAVWDEASADHVAAGSTGERVERLDIVASGGSGGLTNARAVLLDNLDAAVSTRSTVTAAQVNAECDTALADYDAPTRTEATSDKDEILTQLPAAPVKNAQFTYVIKMVASSDHVTPKTGLTVTMTRSLDGAAFGAATGTVTEISTGHYKVVASAADMNGDNTAHRFTGTDADDLTVVWKTVS